MIVISLDEGGHFEQLTGSQCCLIGGLAFQCADKKAQNQESACLETFFRTICQEQNGKYPCDLHYNWKNGVVGNAAQAKKVKKALEAELSDYLQKTGRWTKDRPESGKYFLFCMVGDENGLGEEATGNMRDNIATIRYDHMIYRTIENLIFYNPGFAGEKDFSLQFPTRVVNLDDKRINRAELEQELINLGYRKRRDDKGKEDPNTYEVTNSASFRTSLESALLNCDRHDLHFDLKVNSICYKADKPTQRFLYLADTLCTVYQEAIGGKVSSARALPSLKDRIRRNVGDDQTFVWAYHPTDVKWRRIWDNYRHGNWFDAMREAGEISTSRDPVEKVYQKIWIQRFESAITNDKTLDIQALKDSIIRLDYSMQDMQKRNQETALYMIGIMQKCRESIRKESIRGEMEYGIAKVMTGLYNHKGNFRKAKAEYTKAMQAAKYITIEEYLGFQLLYIVGLCDSQHYKEAEALASRILAYHDRLKNIKDEIYPDNQLISDSCGRAMSQHAQTLAFLGRLDEAEQEFREAMKAFPEREGDWLMTGSFLLHALIDKGDRIAYEKEAKVYFGAETKPEQYKAILSGKCGRRSFALYLFLKGLWVYGTEGFTNEDIMAMIKEIREIKKAEGYAHPWEQIMKYCAFLWRRHVETKNSIKVTTELMNLSREVLQGPEGILQTIAEENEKQFVLVIQGKDYTSDSTLNFTYR